MAPPSLSPGAAPAAPRPAPLFLLAGGRWRTRRRPDPLLQAVLRQAPRARPSVAYVGAASGDDPGFFRWLRTLLADAGAGEVVLAPVCGRRADPPLARAVLSRADLVFVSGGDVFEGMQNLRRAGLVAFLRRLHRGGKVFVGLSAGTIMLGRAWVHWPRPHDDASAQVFACLGLADLVCDTHAEAEDWEELRALLRRQPDGALGYGIPTGGALRVFPSGRIGALARPVTRLAARGGRLLERAPLRPRPMAKPPRGGA